MKFEQRDKSLIVYTEDDAPVADHNYQRELERLHEQSMLKPGEVHMIDVMHDDWCGVYSSKRCNCNPDIRDRARGGNR